MLLPRSALFGWVDRELALLPHSIGLLVMGVAASLALLGVDALLPGHRASGLVRDVLGRIDVSAVVMDGMLAFLIFAGALSVDVPELRRRAWPVVALALVGTALSTAVVGAGLWALSLALGRPLPFGWGLVFGALISPTDPVAVMSTLKSVDLPESLDVQIQGEPLFNDGIGIALFTVLLRFASGASADETSPGAIGFSLAEKLGAGGPRAIVAAGPIGAPRAPVDGLGRASPSRRAQQSPARGGRGGAQGPAQGQRRDRTSRRRRTSGSPARQLHLRGAHRDTCRLPTKPSSHAARPVREAADRLGSMGPTGAAARPRHGAGPGGGRRRCGSWPS